LWFDVYESGPGGYTDWPVETSSSPPGWSSFVPWWMVATSWSGSLTGI